MIVDDVKGNTTWQYDIKANPKNQIGVSNIKKTIVVEGSGDTDLENDKCSQVESYKIGDTITYRIDADVPSGVENLTYYYIKENASSGLTIENIQVYGSTDEYSITDTSELNNNSSNVYKWDSDKKIISFATKEIKDYSKLYIYVTAKLDTDAIIGGANTNSAILYYSSSNTSGSETPQTPTDPELDDPSNADLKQVETDPETAIYTYQISLTKEGENNTKLSDVEFELLDGAGNSICVTGSNGSYNVDSSATSNTVVTGTDGTLTISGLSDGLYQLKETKTNAGYTLLSDTIIVNIKATDNNMDYVLNTAGDYFKYENGCTYYTDNTKITQLDLSGFTVGDYVKYSGDLYYVNDSNTNPTKVEKSTRKTTSIPTLTVTSNIATVNNGIISFTVINKKGFTLPETGGKGIYIFTITGLLIMAGAVVLMVKNKKKSK